MKFLPDVGIEEPRLAHGDPTEAPTIIGGHARIHSRERTDRMLAIGPLSDINTLQAFTLWMRRSRSRGSRSGSATSSPSTTWT